MSVGLSFISLTAVCLFLTVLGSIWLYRCFRDGAVGMGGDLGPAVRRVRQPVKFWIAISALTLAVLSLFVLLVSLLLLLEIP